jgi:hypothetical protein
MKYYVYEILFSVSINAAQKNALEKLNDNLPDQIIVNTALPTSNDFAMGKEIGNKLEVESETNFDMNTLNIAVTLTNEELGSEIIESITPTATNIVGGDDAEVLTDLVSLIEV